MQTILTILCTFFISVPLLGDNTVKIPAKIGEILARENSGAGFAMVSDGGFAGVGKGSVILLETTTGAKVFVAEPNHEFHALKTLDPKKLEDLKKELTPFSKHQDFTATVLDGYEFQIFNFDVQKHDTKILRHITLKGLEALDTQKGSLDARLKLVRAFEAFLN